MTRLLNLLAPVLLIGFLLATWEAACRGLGLPVYFLPPPSAIAAATVEHWPILLSSAWNTLAMAALALLSAGLVACAVGLAIAPSPILERAVRPLAVTLQVTPIIALAPLVMIWAGLDHPGRAVVGLAAVVAFFPIFSGLLTGLKSADHDLQRLFDLYGASRVQRLFKLELPAAAPYLLEGFKVAAGQAVVGAVVAEFVAGSGATKGLAWRILEAGNRLRTAEMFAAVFVLAILALGLHVLVAAIERRALTHWRGRAR
jgi:NitT/TauT family transport system permease protein